MRNTKPPLLFWQAMVAGNWGQNWQLWALRVPSLIYTLLITGAIAATVRRLSNDNRSALIAACVYLAFFSTFRYGRPYLTSAAETFWLDLPMFWLLWQCTPGGSAFAADADVTSLARCAAQTGERAILQSAGWRSESGSRTSHSP